MSIYARAATAALATSKRALGTSSDLYRWASGDLMDG
jgi:hypothetical protein